MKHEQGNSFEIIFNKVMKAYDIFIAQSSEVDK